MDGRRFDQWSRQRALKLSRRDAMRAAGAGGFGAVLARMLPNPAAAQSGPATCTLTLEMVTTSGPSSNMTYEGELTLEIASGGALAQSSFLPAGGLPLAVLGQATGRAVHVLIGLPNGTALSLAGTAEHELAACEGLVAGHFSGPEPGDLGTWTARSGGQFQSETEPSSGGGGSGSGTSPAPPPAPLPTPSPTPCGPLECDAPRIWDLTTCECVCPPDMPPCGPACCFIGSVCADVGMAACQCPAGSEPCGDRCVASCAAGMRLDSTTCSCVPSCSGEAASCSSNSECCTGFCGAYNDGTTRCLICPDTICGEGICGFLSTSQEHCGACFNACSQGTRCMSGSCG